MAITKNKKKEIVAKVIGALKGRDVGIREFPQNARFRDNDNAQSAARARCGYTVAKKTLLKRALSEKKLSGEIPELAGEIAVAYGKGDT